MTGVVGFFSFIFLFQKVICLSRIDPLVDTNLGLIKGLRATDGDYSMFMGIPYATVDVDNAFGDATPSLPFEDTFEAYDDSIVCPQKSEFNTTIVGKLDCLHLNIYVPSIATSDNRVPVMVYIHGGSFSHGFAGRYRHSPKYLVQHDVIVVTLNYRVGAYGFMCLDTPKAPGNEGLKDQLIALRWIKNNIQAFGGDADKITLFGMSAGGHSVDLHTISSKEKLFDKIILQSGSAQAATVLYEPNKSAALDIAKFLGFETSNTDEALTYLSKVDTNLVVAAARELNIIFKPCVETELNGVEPFLTSHWINSKVPKVKNMPVMIGFMENEMAIYQLEKEPEYYENLNIVSDYLKRTFDFNEEEFVEMKDLVSQYYFGDEKMSENAKWGIVRFDSDFTYIHPVQRTIKKYLESEARQIYYYMFSYIGGRNAVLTPDEHGTACCASHSDDLGYLFDTELTPPLTPTDEVIVERMTKMWTNFAKYGNPTPEISELLPVKWLPLTSDNYYYMNIDTELTVKSRPHHRRMAFWNLFYKHNKQSQRWYIEE